LPIGHQTNGQWCREESAYPGDSAVYSYSS